MRRRCTSLRRLCTSLRRLWTSLRRLTTFTLTCLCAIIGLTILTLTFGFPSTSVNYGNHIISPNVQQLIHDHYVIRANNRLEKNKEPLSGLRQDSHIPISVRDGKLEEYIEVLKAESQTTRDSYSNETQPFSTKHIDGSHIPNTAPILNSDLHVNHSSSINQYKREVLELIHAHTPDAQLQQDGLIPKNLTDLKSLNEHILQVLFNAFSSNKRISLSQTLLQTLNDKNITSFQKYLNITLLNQIIDNIRNFTRTPIVIHNSKHDMSSERGNKNLNITNLQIRRGDKPFNSLVPHRKRAFRISHRKVLHSKKLLADSSRKGGMEFKVPDVFPRLVSGIYWSDEIEDSIPKGVPNQVADAWIQRSRSMDFQFVESATWNKCGRPKNAFAVRGDGSSVCVRYRSPNDRLLQGEVMSYWLARLLGLDSVPPVHLSSVDSSQWAKQEHRFHELGWTKGNLVATIMWINEIDTRHQKHVLMPPLMLKAYRNKRPIDESALKFTKITSNGNNVRNDNSSQGNDTVPEDVLDTVISLAQWGSMIIFDYLTGNYDRVASMQDGAYKENKPSIIEEEIRNLRPSENRNKLWLIDNESGLLDAYDLMYRGTEHGHRFVKFHNDMLHTMCIFQRRLVQKLQDLSTQRQAHTSLEKLAHRQEPLLKLIERDSSYKLFKRYFSQRVDTVLKWIRSCEQRATLR